ncbi:hypothetical protein [Halorarum salinum]|uniref:Uncharacterized protein n=1 Tax=Halorarum salinum TaxID=2743089 RepID=A0A7D5QAJ8_9EURY|nr:hypothetical protein [Halobaculum salinum]QLG60381.1 hypothetical protein HUG12_00880 [Halobaculum salinum]
MTTDRWRPRRRILTLLLVGLLVVSAGCAGLGGDGTSTPDAETDAAETDAATPDSSPESTTDDGHEHTHGNETEGTSGNDTSTNASAEADGKLTVVVAGDEVALQEQSQSEGSAFWIDVDDPHAWHASDAEQPVAEALSTLGIDAGPDELSYDGETYSAGDDGTSINVRVNGEEVDPTEHTLSDGDEVWVTVETADMDVDTPGEYIKADQQHIHGPITFEVDGEEVDFSEDRYQSGHQHFHFEGGSGNPWHAHSYSITLEWAMNTLEGIEVSENSVTYDGTTYDGSDSDTTVTIEVNGESVDPSEYFLKDGDSVNIVVETEE